MTRSLLVLACAAVFAGCATTIDPAELAERKERQEVTGSHIKKKLRPGENHDVAVGSREEFERQMDKAVTQPNGRDVYK